MEKLHSTLAWKKDFHGKLKTTHKNENYSYESVDDFLKRGGRITTDHRTIKSKKTDAKNSVVLSKEEYSQKVQDDIAMLEILKMASTINR